MHGGGISTYCHFTAQMLASADVAVTVFVADDSVKDYVIVTTANNIRVIKFNSNKENTFSFLGYTASLSYAFASMIKLMIEKEGPPDFIEAQDYLGIAYYLTQYKHTGYSFLNNVPIIITLHSPAFIYLEYNRVPTYRYPDFWTGEMEKQSIAAAAALISPTNFLVSEIKKYMPLNKKQIEIIANPYKTETDFTTTFKRNTIIYYGKLSPQKGSFELLEYFKLLWDDGFEHPLQIIGGTDIVYHPEMKTMGQLVKEKYATYIKKGLLQLQGKIAPSQITNYLKEAHVIIVPSIVDNMPYVVMEAMSRGKIILASKQGGQKEMVEEGVTGFLFSHTQPETFSKQLKKILTLTDEEIYHIGINASNYIKDNYSFEAIKDKKLAFLEKVKSLLPFQNIFPFLYQEEILPLQKIDATPNLLSVVIPFYNMVNYIDECVTSAINSSYKNIEVFIINDGSTDTKSIEKLQNIDKQKNITIVNRANQGLAATRNYGASIVHGEFLAFLDADDKVAPLYFEKAIDALKQNSNVFFVGAWVQYFENSNAIWPTFTPQPPYALVHNPINSSGLVYKRNAFLTAGLNDKKVDYGLEDYESVVHLLSRGFNGVVLPEILFYYRVRSGSMFRKITNEKLLYSNKYIAEKHKGFYAKFALSVIHLLNANGPGYLYDNPTMEVSVSTTVSNNNLLMLRAKNFVKKNSYLKKIALTLKKIKQK